MCGWSRSCGLTERVDRADVESSQNPRSMKAVFLFLLVLIESPSLSFSGLNPEGSPSSRSRGVGFDPV